ncbi:unnamed protein product [Ascophyllum nodosum]
MEFQDNMEGVWIAEQERIARAVIDSDDACWLFDSANAQDTAAGAGASREVKDAGCEEGSTGGGKIPSGPSRGAGRSRIDAPPLPRRLRLIGGVDVSFVKGSEDNACATLVVLEFPSLNVVYEASNRVTMEYPYVSGFLAFREVHHLARLIEKLRQQRPDLEPDVVFVDGNGRLHPRSAGLACHLGVIAGLRTVGLSKTFLNVDGLTKAGVREVSSAGARAPGGYSKQGGHQAVARGTKTAPPGQDTPLIGRGYLGRMTRLGRGGNSPPLYKRICRGESRRRESCAGSNPPHHVSLASSWRTDIIIRRTIRSCFLTAWSSYQHQSPRRSENFLVTSAGGVPRREGCVPATLLSQSTV